MRIALAHTTYWPEVRRGSERLVHDLGATLATRGHEVTLLTSHRSRRSIRDESGVRVVRRWRPPRARALNRYEMLIESAPGLVVELLRERFDLVHAFSVVDGWAAGLAGRRLGGLPVIFSFHGIPTRRYLVSRRYRLEMITAAIDRSAATTMLSEAAAEAARRYLGCEPLVLTGGVRTEPFAVDAPRTAAPTVLCAASLRDPRKRADLLLAAFARLRDRVGEARLAVVRERDPLMGTVDRPSLPEGAGWIDAEATGDLAREYAKAWATVLPAAEEAFGLVLVESLAAGTPVVAARSGAGPEIVTSAATGRLFEPDDEADLARAMEEALALGGRSDTREACREHAARFDWDRVVGGYEELYRSVASRRPKSSTSSG